MNRAVEFLRRHKQTAEALVEAASFDVAKTLLKRAGLFGAGVAAAAVVSTVATSGGHAYHPSYPLSAKGAAFLARNEGLRTSPYNDPYNCTVGVGHLIHMGPCSASDYTRWRLTTAQAMALLVRDAGSATACVHGAVTHPITVPQDDALIDFTFNVGCGGLEKSSALRDVNAGAFAAVPAALRLWSSASGHFLQGLYTRRVAEGVLFTSGDYGAGIGRYEAPVDPRVVPRKVPSWAWRWAAWKLGHVPFKGHAAAARFRPKVAPRVVPVWAWKFLARFEKKGAK